MTEKAEETSIWRNSATISGTGDKAFWERTAREIAKRTDCDETRIFAALEVLMTEHEGRGRGWVRTSKIVPGHP